MQAEVMSLRGSQWLQLFHEQAQSGQTVARWCREHHVASSIYYRRKNALREELLEEMETEQRQPNLPATVTDSQSEPQFAALAMPEVVREKASARRSCRARPPFGSKSGKPRSRSRKGSKASISRWC